MKLKDAIISVNKEKNNSTDADIDDFSRAVNLDIYLGWNEEFDKRVRGYWLVRWNCTDTWVGRRVYFFDGEPLAVSYQSARKSDEYIEFVSKEAAEKLRSFILELDGQGEKPDYGIVNQDEEVEEFYSFHLTDYFIDDNAFVDNQPVKVIQHRWFEENDDKRYICYHAKVKFEGGEERVVKAEDIYFPLRVTQ